MFFLITWKEFVQRRMVDKSEIVEGEDINQIIDKMKIFNNNKRLTTSDYKAYNLDLLLEEKSLVIEAKEV